MNRFAVAAFALFACLPVHAAAQSLPQALEEVVEAVNTGVEALEEEISRGQGRSDAVRETPVGTGDDTAAQDPEVVPLPRSRPEAESSGEDEPGEDSTRDANADDPTASDAESEAQDPTDDIPQPPVPRPRPEPDVATDDGQPSAADSAEDVTGETAGHEDTNGNDRIYQTSCPAVLSGAVIAEARAPIADGQCLERSPLAVTAVNVNGREVEFSAPATLNCEMATALPEWLEDIDGYARSRENSGLDRVEIGTSQFCRPRNNVEGADLSEHGFANALDVVGFTLENGEAFTVVDDWLPSRGDGGRLLRFAHGAACSDFTTVLGPEANSQHEDHFHLDLGCHGQSCTARICQ